MQFRSSPFGHFQLRRMVVVNLVTNYQPPITDVGCVTSEKNKISTRTCVYETGFSPNPALIVHPPSPVNVNKPKAFDNSEFYH